MPLIDCNMVDLMSGRVRFCMNCEFHNNEEKCPLLMKEPKPIFGRGTDRPYTAAQAKEDIRCEHSCYIHRFGAEEGDKPVCKRVKNYSKPYASCEACRKEYGLEGPPCSY